MNNKVKNATNNLKNTGSFVTKHYKIILSVLFGLFVLYWLMFILTPKMNMSVEEKAKIDSCLLYTSPSPRDRQKSRMPSSA